MTDAAGIAAFFTADHRACDASWASVEAAVEAGDDAVALAAWTAFDGSLRRHLDMEEQVLFPAIVAAGGPSQGPLQVMLMEHQQMRGVLDAMAGCADAGDFEALADHGDTLLMVIQQHNAKEEMIVYRMAEQLLGHRWAELQPKLARY